MTRIRFEGWEADISPVGGVGGNEFAARIGGQEYSVRLVSWEAGLLTFEVDGRTLSAAAEVRDGRAEVMLEGRRASFPLEEDNGGSPGEGRSPAGGEFGPVRAELPGRILEVRVSEGELVQAGQVLLIAETMKMEHPVCAAAAARVGQVHAAAGTQIAAGDVLLELHPPGEGPKG